MPSGSNLSYQTHLLDKSISVPSLKSKVVEKVWNPKSWEIRISLPAPFVFVSYRQNFGFPIKAINPLRGVRKMLMKLLSLLLTKASLQNITQICGLKYSPTPTFLPTALSHRGRPQCVAGQQLRMHPLQSQERIPKVLTLSRPVSLSKFNREISGSPFLYLQ